VYLRGAHERNPVGVCEKKANLEHFTDGGMLWAPILAQLGWG